MAVTLYATKEDVRAAYEGTIADDTKTNARLDALIERACAKLAGLVPSLDRRMAQAKVDPAVPAGMVVEAVLRVWRNPAGATQQGVGPFQLSFNNKAAQNEIFYDAEDIKYLAGEIRAPRSFNLAIPNRQSLPAGRLDVTGTPVYQLRELPPTGL